MTRFIAALGAGFVALLVGLGVLVGVVIDERDDAHAQVDTNRETLEALATLDLVHELERQLDGIDQDIAQALADPLSPSADLLLVRAGEVVLPRVTTPAASSDARALLDALAAGTTPTTLSEAARERVAWVTGDVVADYDAWLDHRVHFAIRADHDLATTLFAIERLATDLPLDPARARALLRDGLARPDGRVEGFFVSLLAARARLSRDDFALLLARSTSLGRRFTVRVDDVLATAAEAPAAPSLRPGAELAIDCVGERCWLQRTGADAVTRGRRLAIAPLLATLTARYAAANRIERNDRLTLAPGLEPRVTIASRGWSDAHARADDRFWLKLVPLVVVALLGAAVFAMAVLLQRRKAAWIGLRSHLLSAVTHELKTPLASIRALAETLERRLGDHPGARDYPARIVASSERLGFLVDNVLSFARLERGAWQPRVEPMVVADLAAWLATDPVTRAPRPIDLTVTSPPDLVLVADPDLTRLLLSNLVDNAAKYATADRVAVHVQCEADAAHVRLTVSDDGPGLGDDHAHLFDEFRRGDGGGTPIRGTGLGLAICRRIMRMHGGAIRVARTSPAGTTFEATFPRRAPSTPRAIAARVARNTP